MVELDVTEIGGQYAVVHNKDYGIDLAKMEALSWDDVLAADESIPLFSDYLAVATRAGTGLFVEAKGSTDDVATRVTEAIVKAVVEAVKTGTVRHGTHGTTPTIILHGFSIAALAHAHAYMQKEDLSLPIGLGWTSSVAHAHENDAGMKAIAEVMRLRKCTAADVEKLSEVEWALAGIEVCVAQGFSMLCMHKSVVTRTLVDAAHNAGLLLDAFVVTNATEIATLRAAGVDTVTCEPSLYE